jgi:HEAT repeat protein
MGADAADHLDEALLDPNPHVRLTAVKALAEVADLDMAKLLADTLGDERSAVRHAAQDALEKLGADVLPAVIAALADRRIAARIGAREVLDSISSDWRNSQALRHALPTICGQLHSSEPLLRLAAVAALATIGNVGVVEPLITALRDENWQVRQMAAQALGRIRDRRLCHWSTCGPIRFACKLRLTL